MDARAWMSASSAAPEARGPVVASTAASAVLWASRSALTWSRRVLSSCEVMSNLEMRAEASFRTASFLRDSSSPRARLAISNEATASARSFTAAATSDRTSASSAAREAAVGPLLLALTTRGAWARCFTYVELLLKLLCSLIPSCKRIGGRGRCAGEEDSKAEVIAPRRWTA